MFRPNNSTITRNMHKVSLASPESTRMAWTTPIDHAHSAFTHAGLTASPNPARNCPFCEGKKKEQRVTSRYLHETGTRRGWGPRTCCFAGSHTTASMPPLRGGMAQQGYMLVLYMALLEVFRGGMEAVVCAAGLCLYYIWSKTGCLRSYCLKISRWCNLLLAH